MGKKEYGKVLITVWPFAGHYFPLMSVAHALRANGHEVAFYTGPGACATIEAEAFPCFSFQHVDADHVAQVMESRTTFASARTPLQTRSLMHDWLVGTLPGQIADMTDLLETWQPDVIVTDTFMWGAILILHESRHIPVAAFSITVACMLPGTDTPPFGIGLPRPRNWRNRMFIRVARSVRSVIARGRRRAVNDLRHRYGLPRLPTSPNEYGGRMPLYMVPSVPEFDYQRQDLPQSVAYIGPCIWNRAQVIPLPEQLAHLTHDTPWVLVSEGTVNSQQPIVLRAAAQGLAHQPMNVIISTGGRDLRTLDLGPCAPNIHLVEWASFSHLLQQVDVLVTTGGAGQVMNALQEGVPLVVVPTEWDKPENAQRIVDIGAGIRLNPQRCTASTLQTAGESILRDPTYRVQAQRMRTIMAKYDGPGCAAQLLERLITHGSMNQ